MHSIYFKLSAVIPILFAITIEEAKFLFFIFQVIKKSRTKQENLDLKV